MKDANFLYTDGRDVVVTQSTLKTKKGVYLLKGITDLSLAVLKPLRLPGLLLAIIGLTLLANGFWYFIPPTFWDALAIPARFTTSNIQIFTGAIIAILGICYMALIPRRYAVRIETAEGEKDAVVSNRREYVKQIFNAVRKARSTKIGF